MKLKIAEKEKWLAFGAAAVVAFLILAQTLFVPIAGRIIDLAQKKAAADKQLKIYKEKEKILEKLEISPLEQARSTKTKEDQTILALRYISQTASKLNLDLVSIKPLNEEKTVQSVKVIYFNVDFSGRYMNIYKFHKALEKLPILMLVDRIEMVRGDKADVRASILLSIYY